jgi:putative copper export protein/methionine-rich copper-binding protein CopC
MRGPLLVVLLLVLLAVPTSSAHASLRSTFPVQGSTLDRMPFEAWIEFSEPVDRTATTLQVTNSTGARVDHGATIVQGSRARVALSTPTADDGYIVRWQTFSNVDGHRSAGSWAFAVGDAPVPRVGPDPAPPVPWSEVLGKFLALCGLSLIAGLILGRLTAIVPRDLGRTVLYAGAALNGAGILFVTLAQAASYRLDAFDYVTKTPYGQGLAVRLACAVMFVGVAVVRDRIRPRVLTYGLLVLYGLTIGTQAAHSHAAAKPGLLLLGAALDGAHLLLATAWIGGLAIFYLLLPRLVEPTVFLQAVRRFSGVAATCAAGLLLSGPLLTLVALGGDARRWPSHLATAYGLVGFYKVLLSLFMVGLGILNHYAYVRPFHRGERLDRRPLFRQSVRREAIVGVFILFFAALLTSLTPGLRGERPDQLFLDGHGQTFEFHAWIRPSPQAGAPMSIQIELFDQQRSPIRGARLGLDLVSKASSNETHHVAATSVGDRYEVTDLTLQAAGAWQLSLRAETADGRTDGVQFTIRVRAADAVTSRP